MRSMPTAPGRPCPGYGPRRGRCPNVIARGIRCCPDCIVYDKAIGKEYSQRRDQTEPRRWIHSPRWRKSREIHLRQYPLCVACERQGMITGATQVDHVIPHKGDYKLFWDQSNWQSICEPCHSRKTAAEVGGFGNVIRG
jgi:5-methylcytosine-specific restriction protein A